MVTMTGYGCKCGIDEEGLFIVVGPNEKLPEDVCEISQNVRNIKINITPNDVIRAEVDMYLDLKRIKAAGRYHIYVIEPITRIEKEVAEIRFKDGTVLNMEPKGYLEKDE